jgi:hypothetical protein
MSVSIPVWCGVRARVIRVSLLSAERSSALSRTPCGRLSGQAATKLLQPDGVISRVLTFLIGHLASSSSSYLILNLICHY